MAVAFSVVCLVVGVAHGRAVAPVAKEVPIAALDRSITEPPGFSQDGGGSSLQGHIDWTNRTLFGCGQSRGPIGAYLPHDVAPYAQRRATSLAQEHLMALLRATPLATGQSVAQALGEAPELNALLYTAMKSLRVHQASYTAHGDVQLQVAISLDHEQGGLGALWAALRARGRTSAKQGEGAKQRRRFCGGEQNVVQPLGAQASGIIINARGTGFMPAVWPRIISEQGAVLYDAADLEDDVLILRGLMGATRSLDGARADERVAPMPVIFRAQPCAEGDPHTLVLARSEEDALRQQQSLLCEGRVMVVVD